MSLSNIMQQISVQALPFIFAITLHEAAHAWAANKCGDNTAKNAGRISLNPINHIDLYGTIIIPLMLKVLNAPFLFGYAKPVPVNFDNLNNPKRDMAIVAFAGPFINICLAIISGILFQFFLFLPKIFIFLNIPSLIVFGSMVIKFLNPLILMLQFSVIINFFLCFINLIPIIPLDGGRILAGLLPDPYSTWLRKAEPYGLMLFIMLFLFDPLNLMTNTLTSLVRSCAGLVLG